jgi:6-phosphofructokinase 1
LISTRALGAQAGASLKARELSNILISTRALGAQTGANMAKEIQTIGVLTSGGDAPGMNAAIRAVTRTALAKGIAVKGIRKGYQGLLSEEIFDMNDRSVSDIVQRGGTILGTARCPEFMEKEGQEKGAMICRKHGIDSMVVIGGDGSYRGALALSKLGINTIGLPGTIDLDIACTDYTIGFDTAVNTAMEAIDKVKDTSASHERCSIIEVMGRNAGYLALWCGIANGAEDILIPGIYQYNEQDLVDHIMRNRRRGKTHHIIINAEGIGHSIAMAKRIETATGLETRATILGYMQRGGSPTCKDRFYASIMGAYAVTILKEGKSNRAVCYRTGAFTDVDFEEALNMHKEIDAFQYDVSRMI